jgi:type II secretory pathway pseudopilin PulG
MERNHRREALAMKRVTAGSKEQGFAVLQMLVVFAIVAAVAGIGLPVYASRAKHVVLEQNVESLEVQVKGLLALDGDAVGDDSCLAAGLARALSASDAGRYVNPLSGSDGIVWQDALSDRTESGPPAIWITDDSRYAHEGFVASGDTRCRLAGTLLVVLRGRNGTIAVDETIAVDVFYVDGEGRKSTRVETLAQIGG